MRICWWIYERISSQNAAAKTAIVRIFPLPPDLEFVVLFTLRIQFEWLFKFVRHEPIFVLLRPRIDVFLNLGNHFVYFFLEAAFYHAHILTFHEENPQAQRVQNHNDRVVNDERKDDTNQQEAENVSDMRFHKVWEAEHEHAQNVYGNLVYNVLLVDDPILPLVFGQHVPKHDKCREDEQQDVPESDCVHANDNQSIDDPPCKEHDRVDQSHIPRMVNLQPIIDRPVSFRLHNCIRQSNLRFCPSLYLFQLIGLFAWFALF